MSLPAYFAFVVATIVLVIVPGPTVTLIIANSLRHGRRAGMLNVAGTQIGLALTVGVVLLGLASLIEAMGRRGGTVRIAISWCSTGPTAYPKTASEKGTVPGGSRIGS